MKKILVLLTLLIAIAGCSESTDPSNNTVGLVPGDTTVMIPLSIGNTWYGYSAQYDEYGTIVRNGSDTTTLVKDTTINGEKWYLTNAPLTTAVTNRADGYYIWPLYLGRDGLATMAAKFPTQKGDTFGLGREPYIDEEGDVTDTLLKYFEVASTDTVIKVRAGTFHCYEYLYRYKSALGVAPDSVIRHPDNYFYSRGFGFISYNLYGKPVGTLSSLILHWELTSVALKH